MHETDIGGTYNAFEAARRAGVKRLIFASSNHAVGRYEVDNLPAIYEPGFGLVVRTDAEYRPDSLYGVWKVFGEALGRYYSDAFGLQVTCVRIGSMTKADDPRDESVRQSSGWLPLNDEQKFARYAATFMSQRDFARLVRASSPRTCRSRSSTASVTTRRASGTSSPGGRSSASGPRTVPAAKALVRWYRLAERANSGGSAGDERKSDSRGGEPGGPC